MAYKALYRKYRPSTFDEVAGQQHVVKTLKNALANGKIAHAYLFTGPRGTGKTTMAKLLAKALNCEEGVGYQCNQCKNCLSIMDGTHPDVLEIDAASNNGVDEVRDIIDKVKYGTILGKYKVYIIDEVHMMTPGAFNALLKTLEEPPEHVIFILATTEPHKIIPTILSRCQRYDFSKVSINDMKKRIREVLESENISYDEESINLIISLADGGMRDALSMLDQVLAYSGNVLNVNDILNIFALESTQEKISLLSSISEGNVSDVLDKMRTYIDKGSDIKRLSDDLLTILKDMLIYKSTKRDDCLEILKNDEVNQLIEKFTINQINQMISTLLNTIKDYKNVTSIASLFEVTLLNLCTNHSEKTMDTGKIDNKDNQPIIEKKTISTDSNLNITSQTNNQTLETLNQKQMDLFEEDKAPVIPQKKIILDKEVLLLKGIETETSFEISDDLMVNIMVSSKKDIKNSFLENWKQIKQYTTHPKLGKTSLLLIDGYPLVASNKVLIIEYQTEKVVEKINAKENQGDIQNVIQNCFNRKMFVFAVSRKDSVRYQKIYMDLKQLNRLPKINDITIEFIGDK